jgi:inward rectifier potassium channel
MVKEFFKNLNEYKDSGFGSIVNSNVIKHKRLINRDGSFNVIKKGVPFIKSFGLFHFFISMHWLKLSCLILFNYFFINLIFATIYYYIGIEHLSGVIANTEKEKFFEGFFFSVQTLTTIGYGRISPLGFETSIVASIEGFVGVLGFALTTGIIYGRFAKPQGKLLFSNHALIVPNDKNHSLMFRLANFKNNQLLDVSIKVMVAYIENGSRKFVNLELERSSINFFQSAWTIVHPIDESSIFYNITKELLDKYKIEILYLIKAYDDTTSQYVLFKGSYLYSEIVLNARFKSILSENNQGYTVAMIDELNSYIKL